MTRTDFGTFPRSEIVLARDNLAEVAAFVFQDKSNIHHKPHLLGNLVLATAATAESISPIRVLAAEVEMALVSGGLDPERSAKLVEHIGMYSQHVFSLRHIPDNAPEILLLRKVSRELNVSAFVAQAHMLNPDKQPDSNITGLGQQIFIESYPRELS